MEQIARSPKQVGDAVRRRRRSLGLNQAQVGERTTLRQATVSAVEAGAPGTQIGTLFDLLAALDLEFVIRPRTKATPADIQDIF